MIVNFRICRISRDAYKLGRTPTLINKKKKKYLPLQLVKLSISHPLMIYSIHVVIPPSNTIFFYLLPAFENIFNC